jgi:hypothetical protein
VSTTRLQADQVGVINLDKDILCFVMTAKEGLSTEVSPTGHTNTRLPPIRFALLHVQLVSFLFGHTGDAGSGRASIHRLREKSTGSPGKIQAQLAFYDLIFFGKRSSRPIPLLNSLFDDF